MRRIILFIIISTLLFPIFSKKIFAVDILISNAPAEINISEFSVDVKVKGAKKATNYLRLLLYKSGTHNYFGETWNGNSWIKSGSGKDYLPIQIEGEENSKNLKARLGEVNMESGEYVLSVRRYTESGNAASNDTVSELPVKITVNIEKKVETKTESPRSLETPTIKPLPTDEEKVTNPPAVLANITEAPETKDPEPSQSTIKPTSTETVKKEQVNEKHISKLTVGLGIIFILLGGVCIFVSAWYFWKQRRLLAILKT